MPSWMNKRLFYSRDPRWLGTITHNKHHRPRLSKKYNAGFLSKSDGIDIHLSYDSILWWVHVQLLPQLERCGPKYRLPCHVEHLPPLWIFHPGETTSPFLHRAKSPPEHQARSVKGTRLFSPVMRAHTQRLNLVTIHSLQLASALLCNFSKQTTGRIPRPSQESQPGAPATSYLVQHFLNLILHASSIGRRKTFSPLKNLQACGLIAPLKGRRCSQPPEPGKSCVLYQMWIP